MPLLSAVELQSIKDSISVILKDTSIGTVVKYRQVTGAASYNIEQQDLASGVSTYTDWSGVSTVKGLFTDEEMAGGGIEIGSTKFIIMQSSVSNELTTRDVLVEAGTTYNVRYIKKDPLGIVYVLGGITI